MNIRKRFVYHLLAVAAFPLFFLLHGNNEYFGLIPATTILQLAGWYFLLTGAIVTTGISLFGFSARAFIWTYLLLFIFFFFGAIKDVLPPVSYTILLSALAIAIVGIVWYFRKTKKEFTRALCFFQALALVMVIFESGATLFNLVSGKQHQQELGDVNESLAKQIAPVDTTKKPHIFWIVLDEYTSPAALNRIWKFQNPLDDSLRKKGFFVADSGVSPYNYTHYTLLSQLDMQYLSKLKNHSEIFYADIARGNHSLYRNNVVTFLSQQGYDIHNHSIFDLDSHPTRGLLKFGDAPFRLIHEQTLAGRIKKDIWWGVKNLFATDKKLTDSLDKIRGMQHEAQTREKVFAGTIQALKEGSGINRPGFYLFHYMFSHEPFLYTTSGEVDPTVGYGMYPDRYVAAINYTNSKVLALVDSIQQAFAGKDYLIVLQGDHGYKFDERDPMFEEEGCDIYFGIYGSDKRVYKNLSSSFNSINSFRMVFNHYFETNMPLLPGESYNLYYR